MKLGFYVGQAVTVLDGCRSINGKVWYTWVDEMNAFVNHNYIIKDIEYQGDRTLIYLDPMSEEDDIKVNDSVYMGVGDFYFCGRWLAPLQLETDESTELESFFSDI